MKATETCGSETESGEDIESEQEKNCCQGFIAVMRNIVLMEKEEAVTCARKLAENYNFIFLLLGPTLFALYTGDLPEAVSSASLYMYADDKTIYCIGESVDSVTNTLNNALKELEKIGVQRTTWFPTPISVKQ